MEDVRIMPLEDWKILAYHNIHGWPLHRGELLSHR